MKKDSGTLEELKREIPGTEAELSKGFRWPASTRSSSEYLDELKMQAQEKLKLPAVPSREDMKKFGIPVKPKEGWTNRVVAQHPRAPWIEGCEGPRIKDFRIKLELKENAKPYAAQPI